jgi:hypothetical protein
MKPISACYFLNNKAFHCGYDPKGGEPPKTPCWCLKTGHALGPDGREVSLRACSPERGCYRPEVQL